MLYHLHQLRKAALMPTNLWSEAMEAFLKHVHTGHPYHRLLAASTQIVERNTRSFGKPEFGITQTPRKSKVLDVQERTIQELPFCTLKYFARLFDGKELHNNDPTVLIVAPMSGHYATLLRDTVRAMLPLHNVYITDWHDVSQVLALHGQFSLNTYISYLMTFIRKLNSQPKKDLHVISVCQPALAVMSATALLAQNDEPCQPNSMILMGGPIDTQINPGKLNHFVNNHTIEWYEHNIISNIPAYYPGAGRRVCPGFIMLNGFMSMNPERHQQATIKLFDHLIQGDEENAESHRKFYDEYRSVMDLSADYFLESLKASFKEHYLARGLMKWEGERVRPEKIRHTALMTIEGELDDISPPGQTYAAHKICSGIPDAMKHHYFQENVGHYGIFNGSRWRTYIQPKIAEFIRKHL